MSHKHLVLLFIQYKADIITRQFTYTHILFTVN